MCPPTRPPPPWPHGSSLVISKDSEHKAAATEFIKYLTDTKGQADWYKRTKDL